MVQTTYGDMPVAYAGQLADINPQEIISVMAEGDISFGYPVVRGTADGQGKIPSATGQNFLGVNVYTIGAYSSTDDITKTNDTEIASVVRSGYVWVTTEQAVVAGDPVYFVHTATVGKFRKDANTDKADAITGATFEGAAGVGELVLIRLG